MLQCNETSNFRTDAGQAHTPEAFVAAAFTQLGLDWKEHFYQSQEFFDHRYADQSYGPDHGLIGIGTEGSVDHDQCHCQYAKCNLITHSKNSRT
ncbi:hypothetical protein CQ014_20395 [Pseudomonas lurida]|nr:hypothetical protein CQ002_20790 [Pseudomonas sp. MYb13]PRA20019.1 hypothetical protein CQ004_20405 [Pseudomonas lurida]PRA31902.1 hypothetical protein CQ005_20640 [Pseudomonas lurida]PRB98154.1 hypothetical protein CQ014_20395 [Pseudomonas lurida]PRC23571.1 hypothetical protein CQ000_21895 [Pseudomonas lurida]